MVEELRQSDGGGGDCKQICMTVICKFYEDEEEKMVS